MSRARRRTGAVVVARGAGGESELCVVACEEVELCVVARALALAKFLVVAADLVEVLALEGEGEVVEELAELSGGLVAERVGAYSGRNRSPIPVQTDH